MDQHKLNDLAAAYGRAFVEISRIRRERASLDEQYAESAAKLDAAERTGEAELQAAKRALLEHALDEHTHHAT